ncbi:MAG: hypothetical protein HXX11_18365 [Desulfuromonadales bacterium]|nr:hypothetical protein [Desulfuromonadales bacterium]
MKRMVVVTALLMIPLSASASCMKYEYSALNSMSKEELKAALRANNKEFMNSFEHGAMYLRNRNRAGFDMQDRITRDCIEQSEQIKRVLYHKYPMPGERKKSGHDSI